MSFGLNYSEARSLIFSESYFAFMLCYGGIDESDETVHLHSPD